MRRSMYKKLNSVSNVSYITVGTVAELNPYSICGNISTAHGLAQMPDDVYWYFENLASESFWVPGDKVQTMMNNSGASLPLFIISSDSTNTYIRTKSAGIPQALTTAFAAMNITATKWKLVAVPRKIA